jgi:hypothetical protein
MLNLISHALNDARCSIAIQEFNSKTSVDEWVCANMSLFKAISISANGLPSIASCNYQGQHYSNISEFHDLFRKALDKIDDPFNNK